MAVDDIGDVPLTTSAEAEFDGLVRQQFDQVLAHLGGRDDHEDICWLCLDAGQDEFVEISTVTLARAADRGAALGDVDLDDRWPEVWNPFWCREEDEIQLPRPPRPAEAAYPALLAALEGRVLDPRRWIAMRVAARLNRAALPLPTTDDFVAFVLNPEFGDDLIDELRFVARPETYALLRRLGLVGQPENG